MNLRNGYAKDDNYLRGLLDTLADNYGVSDLSVVTFVRLWSEGDLDGAIKHAQSAHNEGFVNKEARREIAEIRERLDVLERKVS